MAIRPLPGSNDPTLPDHFRRYGPSDGGDGREGPGFGWLGNRKGGNVGPPTGILSAFLPGQQDALAQQLNQGFGGGIPKWNGVLSQAYSDVTTMTNPLGYPRTRNNGKDRDKDGKGDDKNGDGKPDVKGDDGWDVRDGDFNNHSATGWMGAQGMMPGMQMAQPQAMPSVQGPAQMMLGQQRQLNPQMLAFLRQRLMGGR
jgi:hypothetical protein